MADQRAQEDAGRVAIVTGAGKGLGRAFAEALAATGLKVVVNNRRRPGEPSSADEVVEAIRSRGGEAVAEYSDVRDAGAPDALVARALKTWGRLDAVILNAGVNGPAAKVEALDPAALREVMEINFFANIALAQAALPHLQAAESGRLVFVASSAGLYGVRGRAPYAASKGALIALALTMAHELRRAEVGVNVLTPYAATQMTPEALNSEVGEMLTPQAAAPMAVWLTSPRCRDTGQVWVAGGGWFRRAQIEENPGGGVAAGQVTTADWIEAHLDELSDMSEARGYFGAEAAFADLAARVMGQAEPEPVAGG
jgi:NAD(P)-dependent dehydrogenase (short-subunit alcohol dehydrogenase family)